MNLQPEPSGLFCIAAFDVDGTLTNPSGAIDSEALTLIRDLDQMGVLVVIATARGPSGVAALAAALGGGLWAVTYQGALMGRFDDARWVTQSETTLEIEGAHEIAELAAESGLATSWHTGLSWYTTALTDEITHESRIVNDSPDVVDDHRRLLAPPHKLMFISPLDETWRLSELKSRLPPSVGHAYSHPNYLEVSPLGVDKGAALNDLLASIGGKTEALIAFGDGENDIPMFDIATHSVAMMHAPAPVRLAATSVATSGLVAAAREVHWQPFKPR